MFNLKIFRIIWFKPYLLIKFPWVGTTTSVFSGQVATGGYGTRI